VKWIRQREDGVDIIVKVVTRSSACKVESTGQDALKIRLTAPPVDGKANSELVAVLAEALGVRRGAVTLVKGARSRSKVIFARGISAKEAASRLCC